MVNSLHAQFLSARAATSTNSFSNIGEGGVYEMATAGPSVNNPRNSHDYTEGASAIDIHDVLTSNSHSRRDSESSLYGDEGVGAMFDGPGHVANPSSVSRMSQLDGGRRSSEWSMARRKSRESVSSSVRGRVSRKSNRASQSSRQSEEGQWENREEVDSPLSDGAEEGFEEGDALSGSRVGKRRRRRSPSPIHAKASVLENLAQLFGRTASTSDIRRHSVSQYRTASTSDIRRPSISQYSARSSRHTMRSETLSDYALETEDEAEERWGYSSGEEDEGDVDEESIILNDDVSVTQSMAFDDSSPPSPGASLPLLASDPIFGGESRIDMDMDFPLEDLDPPPPGPPSRQIIYVPDEDCTIRFIGYEPVPWLQYLWRAGCILTLGGLGLLGQWFPRVWLKLVTRERAFVNMVTGSIVVEVGIAFVPLQFLV
jgi:cation-transporting P-type ATPase 13A2